MVAEGFINFWLIIIITRNNFDTVCLIYRKVHIIVVPAQVEGGAVKKGTAQ